MTRARTDELSHAMERARNGKGKEQDAETGMTENGVILSQNNQLALNIVPIHIRVLNSLFLQQFNQECSKLQDDIVHKSPKSFDSDVTPPQCSRYCLAYVYLRYSHMRKPRSPRVFSRVLVEIFQTVLAAG
jgi:hypothetical protein